MTDATRSDVDGLPGTKTLTASRRAAAPPESHPLARAESDAQTTHALEEENRQLRQALESRIIIEQAKGALSVTLGLSPEDAFLVLRRQARSQRRNIHLVAADVVRDRGHFGYSNGR